ncbi:hypothetical protein APHAL10511_007361 [Amanita phalloides]|nr:hypothetical protein APHAL10511_007361 [Amanita phalloides]
MANSYPAHQHTWPRRSFTHSGQHEQEFSYPSVPDTTYVYTQHSPSDTTNVAQSSLTNGTSYPQSSPTHVAPYGNQSSNQPMQGAGAYYAGFVATSAQNEEHYDGYSVPQPDHIYRDSSFDTSYSAGGLTNDNMHMSDHANSSLPQQDFQQSFPVTSEMNQSFSYQPVNASEAGLKAKRQRSQYDEQDVEPLEHKEGVKPRPGACSRCKALKVKCEFKTDRDSCKRCHAGNHECVIPGRKKRRAPPKREHLLNEIRQQAAQIQKLMAQLESTSRGFSDIPLAPDLLSPILSPVLPPSTQAGEANGTRTPDQNQEAVAEWIAKAKESLGVFGDHISMAGASMPRNLLAGHDQEGDDDDDGYYTANEDEDDEVVIAVERLDVHGNMSVGGSSSAGGSPNYAAKKLPGEEKAVIIPTKAAPFGLFGDMGLRRQRGASAEPEDPEDKDATGIASDDYFKSASASDLGRQLSNVENMPYILRGIITVEEVEPLFKIYFENMNLSVSLLDPVLYTAHNTFVRSPFLFTVICAISSRFYSKRPNLYQRAMQCAQNAAGMALISGKKDVEMCHAYILLSLYPMPVKRLEDQRNWLYLGLAIRAATELNLHLPVAMIPQAEKPAREVLNRTRVWMNCFNLDRSTGGQYGKPPIINPMDYQANHSKDWWRSSPYNMRNFDIQICCYNHCLRTTAGFVAKIYNDPENPTGLNKNADFEKLAAETDDQLQQIEEQWFKVIAENTDLDDNQNKFRTGLIRLAYSYGRLIVLSYGFQHAFGKNNTDENPFLQRCLKAAQDVLHAVVDQLCGDPKMRVFWRHGPEAQSVFVTFASTFLVKLLQPKFASYLSPDMRFNIRNKVQQVIDLLSSPDIAIDNRHGPKLYAKFLKGLLASPITRLESQSPTNSVSALPRSRQVRKPRTAASPSSPDAIHSPPPAAMRSSLSPPPNQDALSFENFAPMRGAIDPFANGTQVGSNAQNAMGLEDLFSPPLSIDTQIIETLGDAAAAWSSSHWLYHYQNFQQNMGLDMRSTSEMIIQEGQYGA